LAEALEISKLPTKKATVNEALREFIQRRKQQEAVAMFGKFDFDPDYDYKQGRRKDRSQIDEEV
jgi:Arc/MetJ family transcription regulator